MEVTAPPAETTVGRRPLWQKIAAGAVLTLLGLVMLVGLALVGINTDPGRRFVADRIGALAFDTGMKIDIGRIDGSIYGAMILRDVAVRDPKGAFVTAPELRVDWRPFAFANSHIDIRALTAPSIRLIRLPAFRETPSDPDAPLLPDYDIDVGRLAIDRLIIEPAVTGQRHVAKIGGTVHIAEGRAQIEAAVDALRAQGVAGGDRLRLTLDAVPDANRLQIAAALDAPAGGLVDGFSRLGQPISARIGGRGDWARWDGRLVADSGGEPLARLTLAARDGTIRVAGPTRPARFLTGPTAALVGPVTTVDLSTRLLENRAAQLSGRLFSDAFTLDAAGGVDLANNRFGDLRLAFALLKPGAIAENLSGQGLRGNLVLNGAFDAPLVGYNVQAGAIGFDDIVVRGLIAAGEARVDADRIVVPVTARAQRIDGLDTVAGGTLVGVSLAGDLAVEGPRILSDNLRIRSDRIDATAIVVADMSEGLYTGAIDGRVDNYRIESVGVFNLETNADLKTRPGGGFVLVGKVRARSTQLFNEGVRSFLGGNSVIAADVAYGGDGVARIANLSVGAPDFRLAGGRGSYSPDGGISFAASGQSRQYGPLAVQLSGTLGRPVALLRAARPGLGVGLVDLEARVRGIDGTYAVLATGGTDYGPFNADVAVATASGPLRIRVNQGTQFAGVNLVGGIEATRAGPFAGRLDANGSGLAGVVRLGAEGTAQRADINLRAVDAVLPGPANVAIGRAIVDARVVLRETPDIVANVQLADARYGDFDLVALRSEISYRDGSGSARGYAEGYSGVPFRIGANAAFTPDLWRVMLKGRANSVDFATAQPARIVPAGGTYTLQPVTVALQSGSLRLAGRYGDGIEVQSRLDGVDLALLNTISPGLGISGRATGNIDFAQASPSAFPSADARLSLSNFRRTTSASVSQPVDVNMVGKLLPDGGEARAVVRRGGTVIGRMVASLRPLPPGSGSWTERLFSAPLGGGIRYNGPADTLFSFAGQKDQRLTGPIGVAADFSGRVSNPELTGLVRANRLVYENVTYGTKLTDMRLTGRFTRDRFELQELRAKAGDGSVSAQGSVSLASAAGYPMDIRATLDNARLARSDDIGATATGQLSLTKAANQPALLAGQIRLPETRYRIVRQGAAEVPVLTGVRRKAVPGRRFVTGDRVAAAPGTGSLLSQLRLDIALVAPDELYVSGMGLESEWQADLKIAGTAAAPRVSGDVQLVRGTLGFAGRSFELQEGRIDFTGGATIDPTIRISASDSIENVAVTVNITGRALDPQISFASVPSLPQDEIVSRILFGSSVTNLSAIQAVQLAASLNSLRGGGGGLNPLGKLQQATGIDRLRILGADEATGRGTALAAGKYITDDIYVEIVTDSRGFTATQLEISLTPSLSLLSQAGAFGGSNASLRYRKDY